MESSHSQQHNIHSTKKRKRGRPRKEVVRSSNSTSQHTSLAQEKPVGDLQRKDEGVGASNASSQHISIPKKRPIGRPRKVQINPTSDNCKIMTGTLSWRCQQTVENQDFF